jgi:16S rRNA (cytosine967-C5)-methyltransferase
MVRRWIDRYGIEETEMLCRANNQRPVLTIRVNRLRTTVTGLQDRLRREGGIETGGVEEFEDFLAVPEPEGLFSTAAFKEGWFIVQDPSAGLPVLLLDPQPEETILDMCSAPGGKAASMAILTGDRARIIAVEKHPGRVVALRENLDRLGLSGVRVLCTDALTLLHSSALLPSYFHSRLFDKILIDAPCSGTGTLSKKSDARWHRSEEQVHELVELQKRLLETAARLVKPGGVIVYSTCSIEWEENEGVIGVFLRRYPTWRPESVPPPFQKWGETMVRTFRHRDGVDGSFCLRLTNV